MANWRRISWIAMVAVTTSVLPMQAAQAAGSEAAGVPTDRISGGDRVATAVAISQRAYPHGAAAVYLSNKEDIVDALATSALRDGPNLFVPRCGRIPAVVRQELQRLQPSQIVLVGGRRAVCDSVLDSALAGSRARGHRISGADRFATAAAVARRAFPHGAESVTLVSGFSPADAVSSGFVPSSPVLLVPGTGAVPPVVVDAIAQLSPKRFTVVGGRTAITPAHAEAITRGIPSQRLSGNDRIATALAVSRYAFPVAGKARRVYLTGSTAFSDALAASSLGDGPVIGAGCGSITRALKAELHRLGVAEVVAVGGPGAICETTLAEVAAAAPQSRTVRLTPQDGGEVWFGGASLLVGPGVLRDAARVTVGLSTGRTAFRPSLGAASVGPAFEMDIAGDFSSPVQVRLPVDSWRVPTALPTQDILLFHKHDGRVEPLSAQFNPLSQEVTASTRDLSVFGAVVDAAKYVASLFWDQLASLSTRRPRLPSCPSIPLQHEWTIAVPQPRLGPVGLLECMDDPAPSEGRLRLHLANNAAYAYRIIAKEGAVVRGIMDNSLNWMNYGVTALPGRVLPPGGEIVISVPADGSASVQFSPSPAGTLVIGLTQLLSFVGVAGEGTWADFSSSMFGCIAALIEHDANVFSAIQGTSDCVSAVLPKFADKISVKVLGTKISLKVVAVALVTTMAGSLLAESLLSWMDNSYAGVITTTSRPRGTPPDPGTVAPTPPPDSGSSGPPAQGSPPPSGDASTTGRIGNWPAPTGVWQNPNADVKLGSVPQNSTVSIVCEHYSGAVADGWWYKIDPGGTWPAGWIVRSDVVAVNGVIPPCPGAPPHEPPPPSGGVSGRIGNWRAPTGVWRNPNADVKLGSVPQNSTVSIVCEHYSGAVADGWWYKIDPGGTWPAGWIVRSDVVATSSAVPRC